MLRQLAIGTFSRYEAAEMALTDSDPISLCQL
jgi:hypothetical protein